MKIVPRDYQNFAIDSIFKYFENGGTGNPLVALPTGAGKSIVIGGFIERVFSRYKNQRILVLTHVKELIEQNHAKLMQIWPEAPAGIHSAGLGRRDILQPIIFGGIGSVDKKAPLFGKVDLIFVDECHLVNPEESGMYGRFFKAVREINPYVKIIGLTATKYRLGYGLITDDGVFTDVCCDMTTMEAFNWFINQGYLAPLIPKQVENEFDASGIKMRGGEFIANELINAIDKREITEAAVKESIEMAKGRKRWLGFSAGVEHAEHMADFLNFYGVKARCVHSKMTEAERDANILWFKEKNDEVRALTNNAVLTTGFDCPSIDFILDLGPTSSPVRHVQKYGRGTRPDYAPGFDLSTQQGRLEAISASSKHNCLVADFGGNTRRNGPINDPIIPKKKGKGGGEAPIKECDACHTLNHASARHCIFCGKEFKFETKIKQSASTAALIAEVQSPIVEVYEVDHIRYQPHEKAGAPLAFKVMYQCGLNTIYEWVCLEHENYASVKAREWWKKRTAMPPPKTTAEALEQVENLPAPTHLRVWVNKKPYSELLAACFDGTAFGTLTVSDTYEPPTIEVQKVYKPVVNLALADDDIPF